MTPSPLNVAAHLVRLAAAEPDRAAVHVPRRGVKPRSSWPDEYITLTFAQLNADSDALAHGLSAAGISRGTRTAVMVPPGLDFFSLTFALFKVAAVPVLIDPGMGVRNLGKCLAEAGPEAFIGIPKAHLARRLFGWARETIRTTVNSGRTRFFCDYSLNELREKGRPSGPFPLPEVSADDTAAILFTSGSTGVAKGVVYTHGIFSAQVELLRTTYGIEPGEIDLCTFPLFALFGPALGMTCVVPDMNPTRPARIDPRKAVKQLRQLGVTNLFGSPAVIRRLAENQGVMRQANPLPNSTPLPASGRCRWGLDVNDTIIIPPSIRRVISAGAPASAAVLERFSTLLLPGAEVFTPYGATEALPISNIGSEEILAETRHLTDQGKGVCVGRPVAGVTVSVIPISDDPLAEYDSSLCLSTGQIGEFVVRGPVVAKAYYNRPEQTRLAKIYDPRTGEILHRMGDVGYIDDRGRLWYCGRKSHRVETPHGTLFTEQVEGVFNTVEGVYRTALVGVTQNNTSYPVLCVECLSPRHFPNLIMRWISKSWDKIVAELKVIGANYEHTAFIDAVLKHPGFPVDVRHNAKIFREKLAVWADRKLGPHWNPGRMTKPRPAPLPREPVT